MNNDASNSNNLCNCDLSVSRSTINILFVVNSLFLKANACCVKIERGRNVEKKANGKREKGFVHKKPPTKNSVFSPQVEVIRSNSASYEEQ